MSYDPFAIVLLLAALFSAIVLARRVLQTPRTAPHTPDLGENPAPPADAGVMPPPEAAPIELRLVEDLAEPCVNADDGTRSENADPDGPTVPRSPAVPTRRRSPGGTAVAVRKRSTAPGPTRRGD